MWFHTHIVSSLSIFFVPGFSFEYSFEKPFTSNFLIFKWTCRKARSCLNNAILVCKTWQGQVIHTWPKEVTVVFLYGPVTKRTRDIAFVIYLTATSNLKKKNKTTILLVLEETSFTGLFNLPSLSTLFFTPAVNISLCFTHLYPLLLSFLLLSQVITCTHSSVLTYCSWESIQTARKRHLLL